VRIIPIEITFEVGIKTTVDIRQIPQRISISYIGRLEEKNYLYTLQRNGKQARLQQLPWHHIAFLPGKRFAFILLERIKRRLIATRRKERSGYTPHRSTIGRICTLNFILQGRREFQRPLWIAYVDLKAAF